MKRGALKLKWVGGGAQRPVWRVKEPKKTGARSSRARSAAKTHYLGKKMLIYLEHGEKKYGLKRVRSVLPEERTYSYTLPDTITEDL
jgi:hypothetical protein